MRSSVTPRAARNTGISPHTIPSFRLLTIPAWLAANSARSRQLTPRRAHEIDLHDHGRGPTQALVDTEQDVGEHDPPPARRPDDEQRHREPREPPRDEQRLASDPVGEMPGKQVGQRFDYAKA